MLNKLNLANMLAVLIMLLLPHAVMAADWNTNDDGVVLNGYDVVSYRTNDKAVKGSSDFSAEYDGVRFYFSSQANKDLFDGSPEVYAPKYNGYCAFAVGKNGAKVPANPETFKMYNGELLVFFNDLYEGNKFNTKVPWNEDENELYSKAQHNWVNLK